MVERRLQMERRGVGMWRIARFVGRAISHVPFVRGIFVSGQLCRYIADEKSDIDYFVVTEPGRLWIVRTMFLLIRVVFLFNNRKYLCANYYVSTDNLRIRDRKLYVACEVASVKPLFGSEVYSRFLSENRWISSFYPNYAPQRMEIRGRVFEQSVVQKVLERIIPSRLAERLDRWLMERSIAMWHRKFGERAEELRNSRSWCMHRDESRAHPDDPAEYLDNGYRELLNRYAIPYD
jgi:hypothetical protein